MTKPTPFDAIHQDDERDALHQITLMLTGTKMLQKEPGVVYSLAQAKARPQDAQAIDQFMQSLEAEKRVALARATGDQIVLNDTERSMLDRGGVGYKDVIYTQQDAAQTAVQQVMAASDGKATAKLNDDGTLALDSNGQIQTEALHESSGGGRSLFGSVGHFFGSVSHGIASGFESALHGINKAYNFVQTGITGGYASKLNPTIQEGSALDPDATRRQDMSDQGYDPDSIWSVFAFGSSGKAHTDLSKLNDTYGADKIDEALRFLADPEKYRSSIESDPNSFAQTADGQTVLTQDATAKLRYLASSEFENLARQINAKHATVGNDLANTLGIDPVHHASIYNATAAVSNIAASFAIDPTMLAFYALKAAKLSQIGIDTLGDTNAASILTRGGPFARNVQRGWKRGIDLGEQFRNAATDAERAAITAKFRAELPGLEPIMENFTGGEHVFQGYHPTETELVNGKLMPKAEFGPHEGIRSLDDAASFISSNWGLLRLMNGRAATQSGLMPGALNAFGYRKFKGLTAAWMTSRSVSRADKAAATVLSRAEADPVLAGKLIDEGMLRRMSATADDAIVAHDGSILAEKEATDGLASAERGRLSVTKAGEGQIKKNLRKTGDPLKESSALGAFSATAIAERSRQAGIRLSTLLPRNTVINIHDARSGDFIYKTALTYLNRGEANTLRAAWNTASAGERKVMIHGLLDQLGHAAGLGQSATGREILARAKTGEEAYMASGNEIVLDGEHIAPFEGQTRTEWMLPSFLAMRKAADKIGVMEAIGGRALNSDTADFIMGQWKMGALFKPSTVTRNVLEGWLRTILEGRAGDSLKARAIATAKNKELFKYDTIQADKELFTEQRRLAETLRQELAVGGLSREVRAAKQAQVREAERRIATVEGTPVVQHLKALESGNEELARIIENGSMLDGEILGRSRATNWLANTAPLAVVGRAYRILVGRHMDEETLNALLTYGPEELQMAMEGYGQQLIGAEMGFRHAAKEATETAQAGWGPARLRYAVHRQRSRGKSAAERSATEEGVRWTHQALDGTLGADRYATALAQRINAQPETARAALANIADREATPISEVVKALEAESKNTAFGRVYFEDPVNASHVARRAVTPEEVEVGKLDWANKVVEEYRYLATARNGEFQHDLAAYVTEHGKAPDGDWIAGHLINDHRPEAALAPQVMAMVPGGVQKVGEALQDIEGGAYQWLVERPLQRTTSSPVFLANYAIARKGLNKGVEKMVEGGMSREAAENLAKDLATRNSWVKTEQLIDDPGQKTQFDVIARNMFPFARATQAMIRRWGTGLWQNPVAARKMMLAYEGAVHSGFIYTNVYGEPTFTYPGSGVMSMALQSLSAVPGFENIAAFPVASDMTGGVLMSVPGADNPLRMGAGPMISIPFREVYTQLLPYLHTHLGIDTAGAQEGMLKVDEFINGPIGTGETWVQLVPTAVRKFYTALNGDSRNSALASSMNGAIANLAAAGLLPAPDASSAEIQQFRSRLQNQVKSQLFIRAVFGLFSPAAPSTPTEGTGEASAADYAWSIDGIKLLSDEYRKILNETGGDIGRATAVFTALHPDRVVYDTKGDLKAAFLPASAYETSRSQALSPGAYLPSTDSTLKWLDRNVDFVKRYRSVSAYFLPEQEAGEPFSDAAYKAQLEFGLRERKTPDEFLADIYVKHAESVFYPADHQLNDRINAARLTGETGLVDQLEAIRHNWQAAFKNLNPFFKDKIDDYGSARKTADHQLGDIRLMLKEKAVPDGLGGKLNVLIKAYDNYQLFLQQHQGQDDYNVTARSNALDMFNRWADQTLTGTPLANVFNGVFRVLNTNFDHLNGGSG